jgi:hypothetical protein
LTTNLDIAVQSTLLLFSLALCGSCSVQRPVLFVIYPATSPLICSCKYLNNNKENCVCAPRQIRSASCYFPFVAVDPLYSSALSAAFLVSAECAELCCAPIEFRASVTMNKKSHHNSMRLPCDCHHLQSRFGHLSIFVGPIFVFAAVPHSAQPAVESIRLSSARIALFCRANPDPPVDGNQQKNRTKWKTFHPFDTFVRGNRIRIEDDARKNHQFFNQVGFFVSSGVE